VTTPENAKRALTAPAFWAVIIAMRVYVSTMVMPNHAKTVRRTGSARNAGAQTVIQTGVNAQPASTPLRILLKPMKKNLVAMTVP